MNREEVEKFIKTQFEEALVNAESLSQTEIKKIAIEKMTTMINDFYNIDQNADVGVIISDTGEVNISITFAPPIIYEGRATLAK